MRSKRPRILVLLLCLLLCTSVSLWAEDPFKFQGDNLTSLMTPGQEKTTLRGNAQIESGTLIIQADEIELSGKNFRYAGCRGNVLVKDSSRGLTLRSDKMDYDRVKKISRLQGYCEMQDSKNEVVVRSGFFEYREDEDRMEMQIGVRIIKNDLTCRSENAVYTRKEDTLELTGLPQVFKQKDEYKAGHIKVNLKTEEILLDGRVTGTITPEKKKEDTPAPPPVKDSATGTTTTDAPPEEKKAEPKEEPKS